MSAVEAFEATSELDLVLDRVEAGQEVVITRDGKAVAKLLPWRPAFDPMAARAAADAIRAMSVGTTLGGADLQELVEEGRR